LTGAGLFLVHFIFIHFIHQFFFAVAMQSATQHLSAMSAGECRDALRSLWRDLVIRPVFRTFPTCSGSGSGGVAYLYRVIDRGGIGAEFLVRSGDADALDKHVESESACSCRWPLCSFYYGFTKKKEREQMQYWYQTPRPELSGARIYFASDRRSLCDLDALTGQLVPSRSDLVRAGAFVAPSEAEFVVGEVERNDRGYRFSRYFVASRQFATLFYYAMDRDYSSFPGDGDPRRDRICASLDRGRVRDWAGDGRVTRYRNHAATGHAVATTGVAPFLERRRWMSEPSFIYGDAPRGGGDGSMHYYYVYQMLVEGDIVDYRGDPADLQTARDAARALFHSARARADAAE